MLLIYRLIFCFTFNLYIYSSGFNYILYHKKARVVQLVRTLISCINSENSSFSSGYCPLRICIFTLKGISSIGRATVLHTVG